MELGRKLGEGVMMGLKAYLPTIFGAKNAPSTISNIRGLSNVASLADIGYQSDKQTTFNGATIQPSLSFDRDRIAVYKDDTNKRIYVSLRGTVLSSTEDLLSDLRIATGIGRRDDPYLFSADKTIANLTRKYPDYKIILAGHSLGGYITRQLAAKYPQIQAFGFNAGAGLPEAVSPPASSNYTGIRQGADVVSALEKVQNTGGTLNTTTSLFPHGIATFK